MKVYHSAFHARGEIGGSFTILMDEILGLILPDDPVAYLKVEGFFLVGVYLLEALISFSFDNS